MADEFQADLEDLALFFSDDKGAVAGHWVPKTLYAKGAQLKPKKEWTNAALYTELLGDNGKDGTAFVVNLSTLIGPADVKPAGAAAAAKPAAAAAAATPKLAKDDLVVIPFFEPDKAYVVKRATYVDTKNCPEITGPRTSDLSLMALTEGTVLANLHRPTNNTGWTCVLLNLLTLRSGAIPNANKESKAAYYQALTASKAR